MRRILLVIAALALAASALSAAEGYSPQVLQKLGFTSQQIDQLLAIQEKSRAATQKAQAELAVAKAQLEKLLVDPNVSMVEVEKSVRAAMEWETQIKLAQVQRELEIRRLIGDRRWRELMFALRQRVTAARNLPPKAAAEVQKGDASKDTKARALLRRLAELMRSKGR